MSSKCSRDERFIGDDLYHVCDLKRRVVDIEIQEYENKMMNSLDIFENLHCFHDATQ